MTEFVLLDVGMGGVVVLFGGVALIIFIILAIVIARISIRAIKKEISEQSESLSECQSDDADSKNIESSYEEN